MAFWSVEIYPTGRWGNGQGVCTAGTCLAFLHSPDKALVNRRLGRGWGGGRAFNQLVFSCHGRTCTMCMSNEFRVTSVVCNFSCACWYRSRRFFLSLGRTMKKEREGKERRPGDRVGRERSHPSPLTHPTTFLSSFSWLDGDLELVRLRQWFRDPISFPNAHLWRRLCSMQLQ